MEEGASGLMYPNHNTVEIRRMELYHRRGHVYHDNSANRKETLKIANDHCETCPNTVKAILKGVGYRGQTSKDKTESNFPANTKGLPIHTARPPEQAPSNPGRVGSLRYLEDERRSDSDAHTEQS